LLGDTDLGSSHLAHPNGTDICGDAIDLNDTPGETAGESAGDAGYAGIVTDAATVVFKGDADLPRITRGWETQLLASESAGFLKADSLCTTRVTGWRAPSWTLASLVRVAERPPCTVNGWQLPTKHGAPTVALCDTVAEAAVSADPDRDRQALGVRLILSNW